MYGITIAVPPSGRGCLWNRGIGEQKSRGEGEQARCIETRSFKNNFTTHCKVMKDRESISITGDAACG